MSLGFYGILTESRGYPCPKACQTAIVCRTIGLFIFKGRVMFNLSEQLSELRTTLIVVVLMVAAAIIGLAWASIGLFNALQIWLGPIWGPVALGGTMILPLILYVLVKQAGKRRREEQQALLKAQTQAAHAQSAIVHIQRILDALKGRSPVLASAAAVVAGLLASRFPSLLAIVSELISAWGEDMRRRDAERDD